MYSIAQLWYTPWPRRPYGNHPNNRTNHRVRSENNAGAKNDPTARLPASARVGYGAITPASADNFVRCAIAKVHCPIISPA